MSSMDRQISRHGQDLAGPYSDQRAKGNRSARKDRDQAKPDRRMVMLRSSVTNPRADSLPDRHIGIMPGHSLCNQPALRRRVHPLPKVQPSDRIADVGHKPSQACCKPQPSPP